MTYLWLSGVFFQALIYAQKLPRTLLGELATLPRPSSRLGRGNTTPRRLDFGNSVVRPPTQIPGNAYGLTHFTGLQLAYPLKIPGAAPAEQ